MTPAAAPPVPADARTVVLHLGDRADLARTTGAPGFAELGREQRRRRVVTALRTVAETQQARLAPLLDRLAARGEVADRRGFTVVNRVAVRATSAAVAELRRSPEVTEIAAPLRGAAPALQRAPVAGATAERRSWGVEAIGAAAAWAAGLTGRGVVVGIVDSGASDRHRQLRRNFGGAWRDAAGLAAHPLDRALGHGSGVLSVAVGANLDGVVLGVAPEAQWAACAAFPEGRFDEVLFLDCADWMLTTAQPDVLINAWLLPAETDPCEASLRPVVEAWRAAEILPVFAAGNLGGEAGVNRAPANYTGLAPDGGTVISVGGMARSGATLATSAAGPNRCGDAVFPSLVAPADELIAALPVTTDAYLRATGTSYAAGLAAGAAALLFQRHPRATVAQVESALRRGAADLGEPGPDLGTGYGRLDLPGALRELEELAGEAR